MLNHRGYSDINQDWIKYLDRSTGLGSERTTQWKCWTGLGLQKSPICPTLMHRDDTKWGAGGRGNARPCFQLKNMNFRRPAVSRGGNGSRKPESTPGGLYVFLLHPESEVDWESQIFEKSDQDPVTSEISDLCEISDLILFVSHFASQNKGIKFGNYFFDVCCANWNVLVGCQTHTTSLPFENNYNHWKILDLMLDLNYFFSNPNPKHLPKHESLSSNHQFSQRIWYVEYNSMHVHMVWSQKFRKSEISLDTGVTF